MTIDLTGWLTIAAGLLVLCMRVGVAIHAVVASCLLGAAAALKLPALSDASVMPSHLLLAFLALRIALSPGERSLALRSLVDSRAGLALLVATAFAVLSGVFLPRIFAGMSLVYSLARSGDHVGILALPLRPGSSNVTQGVYLLGNLACFAAFAALASKGHVRKIGHALIVAAALNLAFGLLDLATFFTGTETLLSVIRNANYRMLDDGQIAGFKRIVGSFAEAGAYGYACLASLAFCLNLWLSGYRTRWTGPLSALLLVMLLLTTSTTAYAATAVLLTLVCLTRLLRVAGGAGTARDMVFITAMVALPIVVAVGLLLSPAALDAVLRLYEATVANKLNTQSGVERMRWNEHALQTFADTGYLGAGLGSVRASSLAVALLANLGILGAMLFVVFFATVLLRRRPRLPPSPEAAMSGAAAWSCLAMLLAAAVSAGSVDLGLPFSIMAALATAPFATAAAVSRPLAPRRALPVPQAHVRIA